MCSLQWWFVHLVAYSTTTQRIQKVSYDPLVVMGWVYYWDCCIIWLLLEIYWCWSIEQNQTCGGRKLKRFHRVSMGTANFSMIRVTALLLRWTISLKQQQAATSTYYASQILFWTSRQLQSWHLNGDKRTLNWNMIVLRMDDKWCLRESCGWLLLCVLAILYIKVTCLSVRLSGQFPGTARTFFFLGFVFCVS